VQLGGAAGTRAAWHPAGDAVAAALADELGLAEPDGVWHSDRWPVLDLAAALGAAAAAVANCAADLATVPGGEGASAANTQDGSAGLPHALDPAATLTAQAAAAQAPGLIATLYAATQDPHRGAPTSHPESWHREWPALTGLLKYTAGATSRLRTALGGLQVDAGALRDTLDHDPDPADLAAAAAQVDGYLTRRRS
jgi:3-carboxy-cis,cis-muconate cycloisomerase